MADTDDNCGRDHVRHVNITMNDTDDNDGGEHGCHVNDTMTDTDDNYGRDHVRYVNVTMADTNDNYGGEHVRHVNVTMVDTDDNYRGDHGRSANVTMTDTDDNGGSNIPKIPDHAAGRSDFVQQQIMESQRVTGLASNGTEAPVAVFTSSQPPAQPHTSPTRLQLSSDVSSLSQYYSAPLTLESSNAPNQLPSSLTGRPHLHEEFHYQDTPLYRGLSPASRVMVGSGISSPLLNSVGSPEGTFSSQWPSESPLRHGNAQPFLGMKRAADGNFEHPGPVKRQHAIKEMAHNRALSQESQAVYRLPANQTSRAPTSGEISNHGNPFRGFVQQSQTGPPMVLFHDQQGRRLDFSINNAPLMNGGLSLQPNLGVPNQLSNGVESSGKYREAPNPSSIDHLNRQSSQMYAQPPTYDMRSIESMQVQTHPFQVMQQTIVSNADPITQQHQKFRPGSSTLNSIHTPNHGYLANSLSVNTDVKSHANSPSHTSLRISHQGGIIVRKSNESPGGKKYRVKNRSNLTTQDEGNRNSHLKLQHRAEPSLRQTPFSPRVHRPGPSPKQSSPHRLAHRARPTRFGVASNSGSDEDSDGIEHCGRTGYRGGNGIVSRAGRSSNDSRNWNGDKDATGDNNFLSSRMEQYIMATDINSEEPPPGVHDPRVRDDFHKIHLSPRGPISNREHASSPNSVSVANRMGDQIHQPCRDSQHNLQSRNPRLESTRSQNASLVDLTNSPEHPPSSKPHRNFQMRPEVQRQANLDEKRAKRRQKMESEAYSRQQAEAAQRILELEDIGKEQRLRAQAVRINTEVNKLFNEDQEMPETEAADAEVTLRERRIRHGIEEENRKTRDALLAKLRMNASEETQKRIVQVNDMHLADRKTKISMLAQITEEANEKAARSFAEVQNMTAEQQRKKYEELRQAERLKKAKLRSDAEAEREEARHARNREAAARKFEKLEAARAAKENEERQRLLDAEERDYQLWQALDENHAKNREQFWSLKSRKKVVNAPVRATQVDGDKLEDDGGGLFVSDGEENEASKTKDSFTEKPSEVTTTPINANNDIGQVVVQWDDIPRPEPAPARMPAIRRAQGPLAAANALRGKAGLWRGARTADVASRVKVAIVNEVADERDKQFQAMKKIFVAECSKANKSLEDKMIKELKAFQTEQKKINRDLQQLMKKGVRTKGASTQASLAESIREALVARTDDDLADPSQVVLRNEAHAAEARRKEAEEHAEKMRKQREVKRNSEHKRQQDRARGREGQKIRAEAVKNGEKIDEEQVQAKVEEYMVEFIKLQAERAKKRDAKMKADFPACQSQMNIFAGAENLLSQNLSVPGDDNDNDPDTLARKQRERDAGEKLNAIRKRNIAARNFGITTELDDDESDVSEEDPDEYVPNAVASGFSGKNATRRDRLESSDNFDSPETDNQFATGDEVIADDGNDYSEIFDPDPQPKCLPYRRTEDDMIRMYAILHLTRKKNVDSESVIVQTFTDMEAANKKARMLLLSLASPANGNCPDLKYSHGKDDGLFKGQVTIDEEADVKSIFYVSVSYKYTDEFATFDKSKLKPRLPPQSFVIFESHTTVETINAKVTDEDGQEMEIPVPTPKTDRSIYKIYSTLDLANQRASERFLELVKPSEDSGMDVHEEYINDTCPAIREGLRKLELKEDGAELFDVEATLPDGRLVRIWVEPMAVEGPLN